MINVNGSSRPKANTPYDNFDEDTFAKTMYDLTLGAKVPSFEELDGYVDPSDHAAYMATAERLAEEQLDAALHSYLFNPDNFVHFVYKKVVILDPWVSVEANDGKVVFPSHEGDCGVDPMETYGAKNVARFIDELMRTCEPCWFKKHLLRNRAEALCDHNRAAIEASSLCGCFSCGAIFKPSELVDTGDPHLEVDEDGNAVGAIGGWVDDGQTAVCPYCDVDEVIGDAMGFDITEQTLRAIASCE